MSTKSKQFNLADFYSRYGIFLLFVVMFLLMSITNKNFLTGVNITNISKQIVVITILACGEQLMVIAGLIDLSVGSVLALSGCVAAAVVTTTGSAPLAVAAGLFVGLISGAVNGGILVLFEIPYRNKRRRRSPHIPARPPQTDPGSIRNPRFPQGWSHHSFSCRIPAGGSAAAAPLSRRRPPPTASPAGRYPAK